MTPSPRNPSSLARCCAVLALLGACAAPQTQPETAAPSAQRARAAQAELLMRQSEGFARAGDGMRAEQYLELALESGADSSLVTRRLVDACVRGQRYRAAAQYVERHLLRHPADGELRFVRAVLLLGLEDPTHAARELEQVLAFDPTHALAHYALGSLQREHLRDLVSADTHFRAYVELDPQGVYAEHARSLTLRRVQPAEVELPASTTVDGSMPTVPTAPSPAAASPAAAAPQAVSSEDVP
jgi:Tfp pilus assembly protein PilF